MAEVPTADFADSQRQLARVSAMNGIAVVSGQTGCGKSFSVDYFLNHDPSMGGRDHYWLQLGHKATVKAVTLRLLTALGESPSPRESEYTLVEELIPLLRGSNAVVVIDEAEHLTTSGLQQLRYFHDRCMPLQPTDPPGWTLVLVGTTVNRTLAGVAELANRVSAWVKFHPIEDKELLAALRAWHPLLAALPPKWLLQIDRTHCHGNWRYWAQFLAAFIDAHTTTPDPTPTETEHLVRQALRDVQRHPK